ncbi:DnaT-like ssDNA-binding protein [Thioclava sp.]|uniref:DnaT-like ssDNA-binding protein n=1 Tax=Thioclava sp. TaxID=1933450 RepID=UPI0032420877
MAYGTDAGLTTWLDANGYTLPGSLTAAVLRQRASAYIDGLYGPRFTGRPADVTQADAWPRTGATAWGQSLADDVTPAAVENATYAAAYAEAGSPGMLSPTYTPGSNKIVTEVKGIKWEVVPFSGTGPEAFLPVLPVIDGLLRPFLIGGLPGRKPAVMVV